MSSIERTKEAFSSRLGLEMPEDDGYGWWSKKVWTGKVYAVRLWNANFGMGTWWLGGWKLVQPP